MWWWVLIWTLLVVIAGAYLVARLWGLWGQVKELTAETERAATTLSALEAQVDRLGSGRPHRLWPCSRTPATCATTAPPRAALREQRAARRAERLPRWARDVD